MGGFPMGVGIYLFSSPHTEFQGKIGHPRITKMNELYSRIVSTRIYLENGMACTVAKKPTSVPKGHYWPGIPNKEIIIPMATLISLVQWKNAIIQVTTPLYWRYVLLSNQTSELQPMNLPFCGNEMKYS